jgi:histidinol phosphatase-like PHP family hydrolase
MFELSDLHNHTNFSDGTLNPHQLKALADKIGMSIGISDHLEYGSISTVDIFNEYVNTLNMLGVHKGVELGLVGDVPVPYELLDKLDYIIGGLHRFNVEGQNIEIFGNGVYDGSVDVFMNNLVRALVRCVEKYPVDILAHPTYIPDFVMGLSDVQSLWTYDRMASIIEVCVDNGVAIEISNRWKVPHEDFIRIAIDMGAIFSASSDGHSERWYLKLDYPLSVIESLGIPESRIFSPDSSVKRLRMFV